MSPAIRHIRNFLGIYLALFLSPFALWAGLKLMILVLHGYPWNTWSQCLEALNEWKEVSSWKRLLLIAPTFYPIIWLACRAGVWEAAHDLADYHNTIGDEARKHNVDVQAFGQLLIDISRSEKTYDDCVAALRKRYSIDETRSAQLHTLFRRAVQQRDTGTLLPTVIVVAGLILLLVGIFI